MADIIADLPKMAASPKERLARAMPFAGTFYGVPGSRNYLQYGLELVEQGFEHRRPRARSSGRPRETRAPSRSTAWGRST